MSSVEELQIISQILTDGSLTPDACRIVLYVMQLGDGVHEIPHRRFAPLLNHPGAKRLRSAIQLAVDLGYLERTAGGRGHHDRYEFRIPPRANLSDNMTPEANLNGDRLPPEAKLSGPVVVVEAGVNPPIVPPSPSIGPLADDAERLIEAEAEVIADAVKPLRSYLRRRVPPERQEPYVGRVIAALSPYCLNPQWRDATGSTIPIERRPALMADALNELATADEDGDRRWKAGDFGNLRNKLLALMRLENETPVPAPARAAGGWGRRRDGPRDRPADWQDYGEGTTEFTGLNG